METLSMDALKKQAVQQFDGWVIAIPEDQRGDNQLIQGQILSLAREVMPDPCEVEYDDDVIRAILRHAVEDTALAINQPEDIDELVMDYASNAAHLRPISLIHSNIVTVVRCHLINHWRQHTLNPHRDPYE